MSAQKSSLQIVFVTTEVAPWSKVGGLADVLSALPPALAARNHHVMVVSPRYAEYEDTLDTGTSVPVLLPPATSSHSLSADSFPPGDSSSSLTGEAAAPSKPSKDSIGHALELQPSSQELSAAPGSSDPELANAERKQQQQRQDSAQYYLCQRSGVDHVFVDHPLYCRTSDIYGSSNVNTYQEAGDFPDLDLRYSILCQAALAAPLLLWQDPARAQPQLRHAEQPSLDEGDAPGQALFGSMAGVQAGERPKKATLSIPQLHSRLPEALHLEPAGDKSAATSAPAHAAAGSPEGLPAPAAGPDTAGISAPSTSAAVVAVQGSRSGAEQGQAGQPGTDRAPIVFVSNDWPCAPLALRLKHTLQCAQTSAGGSSALLGRAAQEGEADLGVSQGSSEAAAAAFWGSQSLRDSVRQAKTAFCIHNLAYQGFMPLATFPRLCLPDDALPPLLWPPLGVEGGSKSSIEGISVEGSANSTGRLSEGARTASSGSQNAEGQGKAATSVNWMHAALLDHDLILTVSPGYALEICSDAAMACGMQDVLQRRGVRGIMNGLDTKEWDPAVDRFLPQSARFDDAAELVDAKAHAKALLQREQGLVEDPEAPIVAYVGRLAAQKGMDVLLSALPALFNAPQAAEERDIAVLDSTWDEGVSVGAAAKKVQVVILGTGEAWMQHAIAAMGNSFRGRAAGIAKFDERTAHLLMAAADYVIIPSRFEPCGLVAQSAARYGAVPIVTAVGGLKDFVTEEVGYRIEPFGEQHSVPAQRKAVADLLAVVREALSQHGSPRHRAMQQHCIALNLSWDKAAADWEDALMSLCCPA